MYVWMEGENKGCLWVSRNVQCESASLHHSTSICLLLSLMSWWQVQYSKLMRESSHQLGLFFSAKEIIINQHDCPASVPQICSEGWMRGSRLLNMSQKLVALGNKSRFSFHFLRNKPRYLSWLKDLWHLCTQAGDRCCSSSSLPSGGFFPSCWGLYPAVCPFDQNSPIFPVSEETEKLCSNPAGCRVAFCSRAPACPLLTDWAKDNAATRPAVPPRGKQISWDVRAAERTEHPVPWL